MNNVFGGPISTNIKSASLLRILLIDGRISAAISILKSFEKSDLADVLFNIAITYNAIGDFPNAIEYIDRAIAAINKTGPITNPISRPAQIQSAREIDIQNKSYMRPMSADYLTECIGMARDDILMMGAIIATKMAATAKAANYLSGLHGPEYDTFKKGI